MTQHPRHVSVPAARGEQETWPCEDDFRGAHAQTDPWPLPFWGRWRDGLAWIQPYHIVF